MKYSDHFTVSELECPTSHEIKLEPKFIESLEDLRTKFGHPMYVTSCCRSEEHNAWLLHRGYKASPNSFHLIGNLKYGTDTCAVDIKRPPGPQFHNLVRLATAAGWTAGIAKTFIHLDLRALYTSLPPIIYTY